MIQESEGNGFFFYTWEMKAAWVYNWLALIPELKALESFFFLIRGIFQVPDDLLILRREILGHGKC